MYINDVYKKEREETRGREIGGEGRRSGDEDDEGRD